MYLVYGSGLGYEETEEEEGALLTYPLGRQSAHNVKKCEIQIIS